MKKKSEFYGVYICYFLIKYITADWEAQTKDRSVPASIRMLRIKQRHGSIN